MKLFSEVTVPLKTAPGVVLTVRPLTERDRMELTLEAAPHEEKLFSLRERFESEMSVIESMVRGAKEARDAGSSDAVRLAAELEKHPAAREAVRLQVELRSVQRCIDEGIVFAALKTIEGIELDGKPLTDPADFIDYAPAEVFAEAVEACRNAVGMSEQEKGNSESPITSAA